MNAGRAIVVLVAVSAAAQPAAPSLAAPSFEHGHRIGGVSAYLNEVPDVSGNGVQNLPANGSAVMMRVVTLDGKTVMVNSGDYGRLLASSGSSLSLESTPELEARLRAINESPTAWFETWAEQRLSDFMEGAQCGIDAIERTEGKAVIHRFVRDDIRSIYASYTATIETLADGSSRVSFGPPTTPAPEKLRSNPEWKILSPAKYPAPQIVRAEDSIRLELYSNGTSRRLVDYLRVGRQDRMSARPDTPHDSYADDAEFAVSQPRVRANGEAREAGVLPEAIRGPVLWAYIPGYGRYILSFHARPELGFESAGEVLGKTLMFVSGGNTFRIESSDRIAAGSGDYTVHVRADPGWQPADPGDRAKAMLGIAPGIVD